MQNLGTGRPWIIIVPSQGKDFTEKTRKFDVFEGRPIPVKIYKWCCLQFFKRFYLFIFRERGREERGRETSACGCFSCALYWGLGQQPRYVPWLGIEPATLCFAGRRSIHWATPAGAEIFLLRKLKIHLESVLGLSLAREETSGLRGTAVRRQLTVWSTMVTAHTRIDPLTLPTGHPAL